jgi:RNA polymerase subunit RPABC4/transcription elongation factor Spt4
MNGERCVLCGEIIPEGRQVCPKCEKSKECRDCRHFVGCEKAIWVRKCDEYEGR